MGSPNQEAHDLRILGVGGEDRRRIGGGDRAKDQASGIETVGKHAPHFWATIRRRYLVLRYIQMIRSLPNRSCPALCRASTKPGETGAASESWVAGSSPATNEYKIAPGFSRNPAPLSRVV
jgi:hypothetical protein